MSVLGVAKFPGQVVELRASLGLQIVAPCQRSTSYGVGDVVQADMPNGWFYECVSAGVTAQLAPSRWTVDRPVVDGGVAWEPRPFGHASLPTITAPATWTAPSALTLSGSAETGYRISVKVAGGAPGGCYSVAATVTLSDGRTLVQPFMVEVLRL